MRLDHARIPALSDEELTDAQRKAVEPASRNRPLLNIYRTLAHAPDALTSFLVWGGYILSRRNSLPARQREIAILRVGFLCKSGYEFTQHTNIGNRAGLDTLDIEAIKEGPSADRWSMEDSALLRAVDELVGDQFVTDDTWSKLTAHFTRRQCMDLVFTAGQYTQVSMLLNTFGVQLDPGQELDPDLLHP